MKKSLPSIREQLLRIHLVVAFVAVLIFVAGAGFMDWKQTRKLLSSNFQHIISASAESAATYLHAKNSKDLEMHLRDLQSLPGMNALCVYNTNNEMISVWKAPDARDGCPQFILREGIETRGTDVSTAISLMHNRNYIGILYARSNLPVWHEIIVREGIAFLALLIVAYLACRFSSRFGAQSITASLNALKTQIDCLKNDDYRVCAVLPPSTTLETAELTTSITEFRAHLAMETLPRGELKQAHHWYGQLFAGLLRTLRQQLHVDSPLHHTLDDYEQLLRMEYGERMPVPIVFDMAKLLRSTVSAVRQQCPEDPLVTLSVTLQSSMQHEWLGQPKMLSMLLQHLLLIALHRTSHGAVCMRVGVEQTYDQPRLVIKLEDSGPPLQQWQLTNWLSGTKESLLAVEMVQDISWLMSGYLLRALGGSATAQMDARGGLAFSGWVPILPPTAIASATVHPLPLAVALQETAHRPLVMVVEDMSDRTAALKELFAGLQCRVFIVEDHAQAMVWAPVLPFSAIILNGTLPDARSMVVRRLQHLAEESLMPQIPLWTMVASITAADEQHWNEAGVHTLITQPLARRNLEALCSRLLMPDPEFYRAYDAHLQDDFPTTIRLRLPELNREIAEQMRQLQTILLTAGDTAQHRLIMEHAHAVKSASLSLGYYRLAGVMSEIEHALASKTFVGKPHHWQIIADALDATVFEQPGERAIA